MNNRPESMEYDAHSVVLKLDDFSRETLGAADGALGASLQVLDEALPAEDVAAARRAHILDGVVADPAQLFLLIAQTLLLLLVDHREAVEDLLLLADLPLGPLPPQEAEGESAGLDGKHGQQHQALNAVVYSGLVCIFVGVDVFGAQDGVDQVEVLVPAQHEQHHHEHAALLQDALRPKCRDLPQEVLPGMLHLGQQPLQSPFNQVPLHDFQHEHEHAILPVHQHPLFLVLFLVDLDHVVVLLAQPLLALADGHAGVVDVCQDGHNRPQGLGQPLVAHISGLRYVLVAFGVLEVVQVNDLGLAAQRQHCYNYAIRAGKQVGNTG